MDGIQLYITYCKRIMNCDVETWLTGGALDNPTPTQTLMLRLQWKNFIQPLANCRPHTWRLLLLLWVILITQTPNYLFPVWSLQWRPSRCGQGGLTALQDRFQYTDTILYGPPLLISTMHRAGSMHARLLELMAFMLECPGHVLTSLLGSLWTFLTCVWMTTAQYSNPLWWSASNGIWRRAYHPHWTLSICTQNRTTEDAVFIVFIVLQTVLKSLDECWL